MSKESFFNLWANREPRISAKRLRSTRAAPIRLIVGVPSQPFPGQSDPMTMVTVGAKEFLGLGVERSSGGLADVCSEEPLGVVDVVKCCYTLIHC
jgi:hypothetical protein